MISSSSISGTFSLGSSERILSQFKKTWFQSRLLNARTHIAELSMFIGTSEK
jgi:hypothetical protein